MWLPFKKIYISVINKKNYAENSLVNLKRCISCLKECHHTRGTLISKPRTQTGETNNRTSRYTNAIKLITLDRCIKDTNNKSNILLYNKISHNELKWRDPPWCLLQKTLYSAFAWILKWPEYLLFTLICNIINLTTQVYDCSRKYKALKPNPVWTSITVVHWGRRGRSNTPLIPNLFQIPIRNRNQYY